MRHKEADLQRGCVRWLRLRYKRVVHFSVPNEGRMNPRTGRIYNEMGRMAGVPDLFIACPRGGWAGLFVEFKSPEGRLTQLQKDAQERLTSAGYRVETIRDFDTFVNTVTEYLCTGDTKT